MIRGVRFSQHVKVKGVRLAPPIDPAKLVARAHRAPGATMIKGFGDFIKNGNIIDLAVAVVIGTAFAALVTQFTTSFLTPMIAVTTGGGEVGGQFSFNGQVFSYGAFIGAIITFLNTAAVIYFLVVLPMNKFLRRNTKAALEEASGPTETDLLVEIRDLLRAQQQRSEPPHAI